MVQLVWPLCLKAVLKVMTIDKNQEHIHIERVCSLNKYIRTKQKLGENNNSIDNKI